MFIKLGVLFKHTQHILFSSSNNTNKIKCHIKCAKYALELILFLSFYLSLSRSRFLSLIFSVCFVCHVFIIISHECIWTIQDIWLIHSYVIRVVDESALHTHIRHTWKNRISCEWNDNDSNDIQTIWMKREFNYSTNIHSLIFFLFILILIGRFWSAYPQLRILEMWRNSIFE